MEIKLEGMEGLTRGIAELERQAPFALAKALNKVAATSTAALKSDLADSFKVRTPWIAKGIRNSWAKKTSLEVQIGSKDAFMAYQAGEADKESPPGKAMALPAAARPTPTAVTRPSKWPGKLLQKPKFFVMRARNGQIFIAQRKRSRVVVHWQLAKGKLRPRDRPWDINTQVARVIARDWSQATVEALDEALRTAQRRGGRR